MPIDKALLLKPRLPEAKVDVPGVGEVTVRGLSRDEVLSMQGEQRAKIERGESIDAAGIERMLLVAALVDPVLTDDEVAQWQRVATPAELEAVTEKVQELSGLLDDSPKDAYKEFDADPAAEFRVLPSERAGDDRRPATKRDAAR